MKLHLGCGSTIVNGWVNVDYSMGARMAKYPGFRFLNKRLKLFSLDWDKRIFIHDLTTRFPWNNETADIVYSSHTLEDFTRHEGRVFLAECFRVLKKGGILRLVVPDLQQIIMMYDEGKLRADEFVEKLDVLNRSKSVGIKKMFTPFISFPHKCMYDTSTLLSVLHETGFTAASKKPFESVIEDIDKIESKERATNAVITEGYK